MDITRLLTQKESGTLEFKETLRMKEEIGAAVSAFSNASDGVILIGVTDAGTVKGLDIGKKTTVDLAEYIKKNTDPNIFPEIKVHDVDGGKIISVTVKESHDKPVFYRSRAYKRVGATSQKINSSEIRKLAKESLPKTYWDEQICKEATLSDIDDEKVKAFLRKAKYERNYDIEPETPLKEALERLKLICSNKLTNAAVLLFGKKPQDFFMQAETRCARFKGTEPLVFIDMKVFGKSIIEQRNDAVEFVKEHIKLHAKIVGTERVETWEYPIEAIREAITNAVCHRDYDVSGNVQVRIFDDRIEVWNPGTLAGGLTIEKLQGEHESILRNPLVGKCFFLIKFIEQWGTGTNRIIRETIAHGLPEPVFEDTKTSFVLTFRKYQISDDIFMELNERQKKAVDYLRIHKRITNKEYVQLNPGITDRTALNDLNDMLEKRIIKASGEKKFRFYALG